MPVPEGGSDLGVAALRRKITSLLGLKTPGERYLERLATDGSFCFIHINKCGGTSVEKALGLPLIHDTARQRIEKIGRARWDELLSFALVRHPYDKVLSHYKYRVKTGQTGMGDGHVGAGDWVLRAYGEKDPRYYDQPIMFQPCRDWLTDGTGAVVVQHILKLERIDADWPAFSRMAFGREIDLGRHNRTDAAQAPAAELLGPEAVAVLDAHFAKDFETFGYARAGSAA